VRQDKEILNFRLWFELKGESIAIRNRKSKTQNRLSSFDNFTGFQAARADANALSATADDGANGLKVRIKATIGPVVSVAYAVTELRSFAAHLTAFRHSCIPPTRIL
jgi:hypothetical protein